MITNYFRRSKMEAFSGKRKARIGGGLRCGASLSAQAGLELFPVWMIGTPRALGRASDGASGRARKMRYTLVHVRRAPGGRVIPSRRMIARTKTGKAKL